MRTCFPLVCALSLPLVACGSSTNEDPGPESSDGSRGGRRSEDRGGDDAGVGGAASDDAGVGGRRGSGGRDSSGGRGGAGGSETIGDDSGTVGPGEDATSPGGPLPEPNWRPTGERVTWNGISFIVPPGMTGTDETDAYQLLDEGSETGEDACIVLITPPAPAEGDLVEQANDILNAVFSEQGYQVLDDNYGTDLIANRTEGSSAGGWDYVELRAELRVDEPSDERGYIMLIGLGDLVVPILAYSPTSHACIKLARDFGGRIGELRWLQLYYSFEFSSATPNPSSLEDAIIGQWWLFQGSSGNEYVFAANGRYDYWGGLATEHEISPTEIERITATFTGAGRYVVEGNLVALFSDDDPPESRLFRVSKRHAVSPTGTVSEETVLGLMNATELSDGTFGLEYELPLTKVE